MYSAAQNSICTEQIVEPESFMLMQWKLHERQTRNLCFIREQANSLLELANGINIE